MANVKLRIEINSDASNEALGQISTDNMEFANTSIQPNADGVFSAFPKLSNATSGINALTYGQELCFNDSDVLDNIDGFGAGLDDEENPVEVVWGIVNEDKTYNVTLTFTGATGLQNVIVYGDKESHQFPTRAILDGTKEVFSDDYAWTIEFDEPSDTHTIQFTHWNRANYNAVLTLIDIMLQNYEVDIYNGLKSVESLSQSSADTTGIFYGSIENSGSIDIMDRSGELVDLLEDGILDNSNVPITVLVNGKEVQHHISTDSSYNRNSKTISIELGNRLSTLDVLKYKGYNYPDHPESLANLLFDVLTNLRYALFGKDKTLDETEFKQMLSDRYDSSMTLYDYLYSIEVQYPVIEANKTYREIIDEFCLIAQMQMYIDDDNKIKFVTARPKYFGEDLQAIHIPKKNMFSQLDYAVILKNKYDGVQIEKLKSSEQYELGVNVFEEKLETSSNLSDYETSTARVYNTNYYYYLGSGIASNAIIICDYSVKSGSIYVKKESKNYNLTKVLSYETKSSDNRYNYSLKYKQSIGSCRGVFEVGLHESDSVANSWTQKELNSYIKSESNKIFEGQIGGDQYTYTYSGVMGDVTSTATLPFPFTRQSMIIRDEDNDGFWVDYKLIVGRKIYKLGGSVSVNDNDYYGELIAEGDFIEEYPEELTIFLKGDQYSIVFENESIQSSNFENSENSVSLSSNLVSLDNSFYATIKNNILSDYKQGISNATVSISCNDYFDNNGKKVINWTNGEIPQVNQIVYFDNDLYKDQSQRYWKIKGRNFRKTGVPMVDLELEELVNKPLESFTWEQINEISQQGLASSMFNLGDTKAFTLSTGETLIAQIVGFNQDELSDGSGYANITFGLKESVTESDFAGTWKGWIDSDIRNVLLPNILTNMPSTLKDNIKTVSKKSQVPSQIGALITEDKLWLFGESELTTKDKYEEDEPTYQLFKINSDEIKDIHSNANGWWTRSGHRSIDAYWYIAQDGTLKTASKVESKGIVFGFCI